MSIKLAVVLLLFIAL